MIYFILLDILIRINTFCININLKAKENQIFTRPFHKLFFRVTFEPVKPSLRMKNRTYC